MKMERKVQRASLELLVIKGFEEKMETRVLKVIVQIRGEGGTRYSFLWRLRPKVQPLTLIYQF